MVVYSGVTIIDGTGGPLRPEMAIVTRSGVSDLKPIVPQTRLEGAAWAVLVDVKGQYALPGFINSREHLATPPDRKYAEAMMRRDLLCRGLAARCMGDDSRALADLARASRVHKFGPDLYYVALFAGPDFMNDPRIAACCPGREGR